MSVIHLKLFSFYSFPSLFVPTAQFCFQIFVVYLTCLVLIQCYYQLSMFLFVYVFYMDNS